jgi:ATP-dependent Lhr-like helicase
MQHWLERRLGEPTEAQRLAWPTLAAEKNLLLCSPTGSGKTLAAFVPILDRLLNESPRGGVRCLYLAPLKALANDVRKNLKAFLWGMEKSLCEKGVGSPEAKDSRPPVRIRIGLRTGDTSAALRRRQRDEPPEILLTTPESLAVLLSQSWAGTFFSSLRWVVIDEVPALAASKRGCDLSLSLERLTHLTGSELQRIGLSATCTPAVEAARFLVGLGRSCTIAQVGERAPLLLTIELLAEGPSFVNALVARLERELIANGSTLIFTNARPLAERLAWRLRQVYPCWHEQIAVHHSALSASRRRQVERALKQGRLRAAISSTSLELGMDIGTVEGVVLVHPPGGVIRLLQRVGRSGHAPGLPRRGLILTAGTAELLQASVTAASGRLGGLEPLQTPAQPLDVLCQHLAGMAAAGSWGGDEAFELVRRAYPYRDLSRADFDACLDYLSGRRRDGRAWLPPRLRWEGDTFTVVDAGTARLLRRNFGTIVTEEERTVRMCSGLTLGQLEQGFAEQLLPGERFLLDGRCLEYCRREGSHLLVEEVAGRPQVPRWGTDGWPLSPEVARRWYLFRVQAGEALRSGPEKLLVLLHQDFSLEGPEAAALVSLFEKQERFSEIPDRRTFLIEGVPRQDAIDYFLHTPLNGAANGALAQVLVHRLRKDFGWTVPSLAANLGLMLGLPEEMAAADWRKLLSREEFDADLDQALAESATLRARFQRVALTGMMLLRHPLGRRRRVGGPGWGERLLFDQIRSADSGFVLLRQAEQEVRREVYDAAAAGFFLEELAGMTLHCRRLGHISPFAEGWRGMTEPREAVETPAEALERLQAILCGMK